MTPAVEAVLELEGDWENVPYCRGHDDAHCDREYNPTYWGYVRFGKMEYDYARGYASVTDLKVATNTIESYLMETTWRQAKTVVYEEDGNVLSAVKRRSP
jgi:hypothetical protein